MRSAAEIRALASDAADLYWLGGPPMVGLEPGAKWDAEEAHGLILAVLDHSDLTTKSKFLAAMHEARIDTPAGLRALLRLAASSAVCAALSWVLEEPDAIWPETYPRTRQEAFDAAGSVAYWDTTDEAPSWW
jgi:hypothetical protein